MKEKIMFWKTTKAKILAVIFSCIALSAALYIKLDTPSIADLKLPLQYYTPLQLTTTAKEMVIVKTGLFIMGFSELDFVKHKFVFDGVIWFIFNPNDISPSTIDAFSFEQAEILKKSAPKTKALGHNLLVSYEITTKFSNALNFKDFPFDDHRLTLRLTNNQLLPSEVRITTDSTLLVATDNIQLKDWDLYDLYTEFGYTDKKIDRYRPETIISHPLVAFYIELAKGGIRKIMVIFLPLFAIFFLGLLSLAINILEVSTYISISVGSLSVLLGYRFVLETMTPKVGYFTISDKIYLLLLLMIFTIFLVNLIVGRYVQQKKISGEKLDAIRSMRSILFYGFILAATVYSIIIVL
ncbi:hypothetical protein KAT92_01855 [Candidatus Babeliales bacterium]|nr:hypothetical protein [Candidatus Babeliales bacterium]